MSIFHLETFEYDMPFLKASIENVQFCRSTKININDKTLDEIVVIQIGCTIN